MGTIFITVLPGTLKNAITLDRLSLVAKGYRETDGLDLELQDLIFAQIVGPVAKKPR